MNNKQAEEIAGTLSKPSKMPCKSYSLPAAACPVGSKLRKIKGSVCEKCYACKGCYVWGNVQVALQRRLDSVKHPQWVSAMTSLIRGATKREKFFRWHDSGDIQDQAHLDKIFQIARNLQDVTFWLPTKEVALISKNRDRIPENVVVRVSGSMVNGRPPVGFINTSSVDIEVRPDTCPATKPESNGKCGTCRRCWDKNVENVSYLLH